MPAAAAGWPARRSSPALSRRGQPGRDPGQPARRAGGRAGHRARCRWPRSSRRCGHRRRRVAGVARPAGRRGGWSLVAHPGAQVPAAPLPWPGGVTGGLAARPPSGGRWSRSPAAPVAPAAWPWPVAVGAAAVLDAGPGASAPGLAAARLAPRRLRRRPGRRAGAAAPGRVRRSWSTPDPSRSPVDGCLRRLGVAPVPLLVLSHLHADHVGGLAGVLHGAAGRRGRARAAREPARPGGHSAVLAARPRHLRLEQARVGRAPRRRRRSRPRRPGPGPCLPRHPVRPEQLLGGAPGDHAAGRALLLTGDVEVGGPACDLVRAGRRPAGGRAQGAAPRQRLPGSPASCGPPARRLAVVSVGAGNDYGHPSEVLLGALAASGARVVRTDLGGDAAVCERDGRLAVVTRSRAPP